MSRYKEHKVNHGSETSQDINEGTSARTRPYSFEDIIFNRKIKKLSEDHKIEAEGKEDNLERKSEIVQTVKDDRYIKHSSHGVRNKNSENSMDYTSRRKDQSSSVKVESLIVGKVGVSSVEPKLKSEVVVGTKDKATLEKRIAHGHKTTNEDERPCNVVEDTVGYNRSKSSMSTKRNGYNHNEKSERDVRRKERNPTDQKNNDDYQKAEYKRKVKYSEGKDGFSGEVGKTGTENKSVDRNNLNLKHGDNDTLNKHDDLKRDSVLSERREMRGSPPPLHEKPSKRRRRSSSRERRIDRDQKLNSHEAQKHTSYHRQNHTVSSFHSGKDWSGKYASEPDRNSKFSNGSTGHHKGHTESSDKLGGYSPRKRRTEDPAQSPTAKGKSGKKRVGWDTPHTESDILLSTALLPLAYVPSKPSKIPDSGVALAVSSSQFELALQNLTDQPAMPMACVPIDAVQLTQSTQPMRRLIIENVPSSASEKDVMDSFNKFLLPPGASFILGIQPCISCVMHKEKRQSLVEFLTPEYASAAFSFKGCSLLGFDLKIRRPKYFVETAIHEKTVASVNAISDVVEDSPHKIFIGGISRNLSPQMLMEIACAFGPLKAYKFLFQTDLDEPRAFLQYLDQSITAKACAGLNGMKIGGQTLTVVQATTDKPSYKDIERSPLYEVPEAAKLLLADPTEVLVLNNLFDPEYFSSLSQSELEEVLEDVRLECTRFGTVKSINVVTCNQNSIAPSEIIDCRAAKLVTTESTAHTDYSGDLDNIVEGSKQIAEKEYKDNEKSNNFNVEEPPSIEVAESNNFDDEEKQVASYSTCNKTSSAWIQFADKSLNLIDEMEDTSDPETEGNTGGGELNFDGDNKQSISFSAEPDCSIGTLSEAAEKNRETAQVEQLNSVLLPSSICVEYRRSEATCLAAHCFNGRAFGNRIVSVEYIPLDVYRKKFPK